MVRQVEKGAPLENPRAVTTHTQNMVRQVENGAPLENPRAVTTHTEHGQTGGERRSFGEA